MTNKLIRYDQIVQSLSQAVSHVDGSIQNVPKLLTYVIDDDMWRERIVGLTGEVVKFTSFEAFVMAHPPEGLGTSVKVLLSICDQHDPDVSRKIKGALSAAGNVGRPSNNDKERNTRLIHHDSADGKLARLKRDDPDLAERVITGELSAHAAAVEAGFANPKVSINLRNLDSAARTIIRKLDRDEVLELIDWIHKYLAEGDHD